MERVWSYHPKASFCQMDPKIVPTRKKETWVVFVTSENPERENRKKFCEGHIPVCWVREMGPFIEFMWKVKVKVAQSRPSLRPSVVSWSSPGRNTGMGCHSLLQGIFPTQESTGGLLHCRHILYQLSYKGSPILTPKALNSYHVTQKFYLISNTWIISLTRERDSTWPFPPGCPTSPAWSSCPCSFFYC